MPITQNQIDDIFSFHPATPDTGPYHDQVRALCKELAEELVNRTPESREQSLMLTSLQQTMMWANAAIAIHGAPGL